MDKFYSKDTERKVKEYWNENKIYERWVLKNVGRKKFNFLEGPPYTTGLPHLGHMWNRILKDVILRYFAKKGYEVKVRAGFDMHGLPIEEKVEKQLDIRNKKEIETKIGLSRFIKECKEFAYGNMLEFVKLYDTIAHWQDTDYVYMPIQNDYIEKVWEALRKAYEEGLIYEEQKPVWWCPRCQTPLSNQEIELGYMDPMYKKSKDPSIYVKFRSKEKENEYFIIWTTTPWTLTFNLGIMVNPDEKYAKIKVKSIFLKELEVEGENIKKIDLESENKEEFWIVSTNFLKTIKEKLKVDYEIVEEFYGYELEGKEYIHPFYEEMKDIIDKIKEEYPNSFKIWLSREYVNVEEGTGLVHSAPGCGFEDYEVGKKYNVKPFNTVDDEGIVRNIKAFDGWIAKKDDLKWINLLIKKKLLLLFELYEHDYPICWRCRSKVIIKLSNQWFINIGKIKEKLLMDLSEVNFIPSSAKIGFENVIKSAPDWVISRQRYWGIPLPIWRCKNGHIKIPKDVKELKKDAKRIYIAVKKSDYAKEMLKRYFNENKIRYINEISNISDLKNLFNESEDKDIIIVEKLNEKVLEEAEKEFYIVRSFGSKDYEMIWIYNYDLHIPEVDKYKMKCDVCGEKMERVKDVLDVWIDSGSATFATEVFPVDFIIEGYDQLRGWFYSLAVLGEIYFGKIPYKNVYVHGFVLDKEGRKMSKSLGNVVSPSDIIEKYPVDVARLYLSSITEAYEELTFRWEDLEVKKNSLNILWNTHIYLLEYCRYYNFNPTEYKPEKLEWEDRYMLYLLEKTKTELYSALDKYEIWKAGRILEKLFLELSRFYIKITRERIKEDYKTVLWVIYRVLYDTINLLSIITPHISEAIFLNLKESFGINKESIILEDLPEVNRELLDEELDKQKEILEYILEAGLRLRNSLRINIRKPLRSLYLYSDKGEIIEEIKELEKIIKESLNVREIMIAKEIDKEFEKIAKIDVYIKFDTYFDENLEKDWLYREIKRRLQEMRKKNGLRKSEKCKFIIYGDKKLIEILEENKNQLEKETDSEIIISDEKAGDKDYETFYIDNRKIEIKILI
ncbi:isoleucine--tRNA ligase [Nanoarchaeota archaeon NZ13-N]|nr:MAG: isoleucine--tRNA ligase [Nanoarchaeota archaeon NZ13-N]